MLNKTLAATCLFGALSASAFAGLFGSSDGGNYEKVAKDYLAAKGMLVQEMKVQKLIEADISEALDLQSEAEALRAEAKNIEEKGDALGTDELEVITEKSDSTNQKIVEKLNSSDKLTEEQKKQVAEAASKYVPSLIRGTEAGKKIKEVAEKASSMGTPGMSDLMSLGSLATAVKEIPSVGPDLAQFAYDSLVQGKNLLTALDTNGVAEIDKSELENIDFGM